MSAPAHARNRVVTSDNAQTAEQVAQQMSQRLSQEMVQGLSAGRRGDGGRRGRVRGAGMAARSGVGVSAVSAR